MHDAQTESPRLSRRLVSLEARKKEKPTDRHIPKGLVVRLIASLDELRAQVTILFGAPGIDCNVFLLWEGGIEPEEGHDGVLALERNGIEGSEVNE